MSEISKKIRDMRDKGVSLANIAQACECTIYLVRKELEKKRAKKTGTKVDTSRRDSVRALAGYSGGKGKKAAKKGGKTPAGLAKLRAADAKKTKKKAKKPRKRAVVKAKLAAQRLAAKKVAFLAAYSVLANIKSACFAAKISRPTFYKWEKADEDFKEAAVNARDDALDEMEAEAHRRAVHGLERRKLHKGKQVMVPELDSRGQPVLDDENKEVMIAYIEREYSDSLLNTMLRAERPDKYADRSKSQVDNTHSVDGETRKAIAQMTAPERECRLTELFDNIKKVGG